MEKPTVNERAGIIKESFLKEFLLGLAAFLVILISAFLSSGCREEHYSMAACPEGFHVVDEQCVEITDGELDCGATRTFQITFVDAETFSPITVPINATMQNRKTLDDSIGRHRLNDADGSYLFNDVVLCDEYFLEVTAPCFEPIDDVIELPRGTYWRIELEPTLTCSNSELDNAFAECELISGITLCCFAFHQEQFDLRCGR